ncbi:MAG: glycosyltransferase family 4 protein [Nitrospirota bacterium]
MKKILFLQTKFIIDGPGLVVRNIVRHLDANRFIPVVGCMYAGGDLENWYRERGIRTVNFNMQGPLRGWLDLFTLRSILGFMKQENIDLVHTHLLRADIYGRVASALSGTPVISTVHNMESHHTSQGSIHSAVRYLDKKTMRRCNMIVAVSESLKHFLCQVYGIPESDVAVVHNGIEMQDTTETVDRQMLGIAGDAVLVCTVARLHPQKGIPVLVKAIDSVVRRGFNVAAVVVGDGPLKHEISALIRRLNARVILAGFQKDVAPFINAADIFVLPSLWEGFGLALIEAMGFSKPVIATSVGGIPEIVPDRIAGILCRPDDPDGLSDAIVTLIQNPGRRAEMGRAGRERVKNYFTARIMSARYQEIYRNTLGI